MSSLWELMASEFIKKAYVVWWSEPAIEPPGRCLFLCVRVSVCVCGMFTGRKLIVERIRGQFAISQAALLKRTHHVSSISGSPNCSTRDFCWLLCVCYETISVFFWNCTRDFCEPISIMFHLSSSELSSFCLCSKSLKSWHSLRKNPERSGINN